MEIDMKKFHVEEATVQSIEVWKNKIGYDFVVGHCEQFYQITNNEFNNPLALTGIMLRNLYKGNNKIWVLVYARRIVAVAPTITALAKKDFCAIDAKESSVMLTRAWLEAQNVKSVQRN